MIVEAGKDSYPNIGRFILQSPVRQDDGAIIVEPWKLASLPAGSLMKIKSVRNSEVVLEAVQFTDEPAAVRLHSAISGLGASSAMVHDYLFLQSEVEISLSCRPWSTSDPDFPRGKSVGANYERRFNTFDEAVAFIEQQAIRHDMQ